MAGKMKRVKNAKPPASMATKFKKMGGGSTSGKTKAFAAKSGGGKPSTPKGTAGTSGGTKSLKSKPKMEMVRKKKLRNPKR